jgi:hypothetical protein
MAVAQEPASLDLLRTKGNRRGAYREDRSQGQVEFDYHLQTYRSFLRWLALFVAHVAVIFDSARFLFGALNS